MAWQKRGSFRASGSDGQTYTIDIWVDVLDAANSLDPNAKIDGLRSLRLKDGTRLNRVAQGHYQTVDGQLDLTSPDPSAP